MDECRKRPLLVSRQHANKKGHFGNDLKTFASSSTSNFCKTWQKLSLCTLNPLFILCGMFYSLILANFCFSDIYSASSCCHSGLCLIIHKAISHTQPQRRQWPFVYLAGVTARTSSVSLVRLNDITVTMSNCFSVLC